MSAPLPSRLLVTRASGYIGRRTVELLLEAGAENLIAASRYPEMLSDLASRGAEIRKADFDDPATLDLEFAGVERLHGRARSARQASAPAQGSSGCRC
ncbi:SDR family oxidoreductase [Pseudomonas sp. GM79]|uniref:SDR family oxidoreductase n=1 Tax=Pseudomonas sp. GM79 TaxID=1144338 RepID=UPI0012FC4D54|nr:NAD(P)H-binding protein [Pseudomonas sp. GM79]